MFAPGCHGTWWPERREDVILWFQRAHALPVCSPEQNRELSTNSKWQTNKRQISTNTGHVILYSLSNTCLCWLQVSETQSKKLKQRAYINYRIKVRWWLPTELRASGYLTCLAWFVRQPLCLWWVRWWASSPSQQGTRSSRMVLMQNPRRALIGLAWVIQPPWGKRGTFSPQQAYGGAPHRGEKCSFQKEGRDVEWKLPMMLDREEDTEWPYVPAPSPGP